VLLNLGKNEEAIFCFDQTTQINPNDAKCHSRKGLVLLNLCKYQEAASCYDKALQINPNDTKAYYFQGDSLSNLGKHEEAILCYERALEINSNDADFYKKKGDALVYLGKSQESILCYDKAIQINPNKADYHCSKGTALKNLGKHEEAILCHDKALQIDPTDGAYHSQKGITLCSLGNYEEGILCFDKAIQIDPNIQNYHLNKGSALYLLGKYEEALLCFDKSVQINPNDPLLCCTRGKALMSLNRKQDALTNFKKAQEIMNNGQLPSSLTKGNVQFIEETLNSIMELQKSDEMAEKAIEILDKNNPDVPKFVENLRAIQLEKDKVTTDMLEQIEKKDDNFSSEITRRYTHLQENYQKLLKKVEELTAKVDRKFDNMQDQVDQLQVQVQEVQQSLDTLKNEVDNKMDDFYRKLDKELEKLDISPDDQVRVKDYFKAFIGTFSSAFVTSQVIESGKLTLHAGTLAGSLLSTLASFIPAAGSTLSSKITSIDKFLATKEMKVNARNMLGLFSDSTDLSAMIGKTAYEIVLDPTKRAKILSVTDKELDQQSVSLFQNLRLFCKQMREHVNIFLYTRLYKTPSARLGHLDANSLIRIYFQGKISLYRAQEEFVDIILCPQNITNQAMVSGSPHREIKGKENGGGDCNLF